MISSKIYGSCLRLDQAAACWPDCCIPVLLCHAVIQWEQFSMAGTGSQRHWIACHWPPSGSRAQGKGCQQFLPDYGQCCLSPYDVAVTVSVTPSAVAPYGGSQHADVRHEAAINSQASLAFMRCPVPAKPRLAIAACTLHSTSLVVPEVLRGCHSLQPASSVEQQAMPTSGSRQLSSGSNVGTRWVHCSHACSGLSFLQISIQMACARSPANTVR